MDMLALLSMRPEYNDKVDLVVAYGPGGNTSRMGPPMSLVMPFTPLITAFVYPFSKAGYVGTSDGLSELLAELCKIFNGKACALGFLTTLYASPYQLNATRLPVYVGHVPVGSTLQNMNHYYQIYRAKDFVMYDHGAKENRKRYGQLRAENSGVQLLSGGLEVTKQLRLAYSSRCKSSVQLGRAVEAHLFTFNDHP
ncbi:hypothetical protein HPB52_014637 [Rhipicephalus sanguineus]|uniref:Uncharacterized protein n=1 Tax=Rhipicephalus sanguineus TaxID=34632 RepID=A0A9D4T433_RHISA|nr:hypothetical protein HPB52_014637 [Rhipicephalus sanguineus]